MKLSKKENQLKKSEAYIKWRYEIYKKDNWTCRICGFRGKRLEAHHIKTFKNFPELRFDIDNGITLCFNCHRQIYGKEKLVEKYFLGLKEKNGVNSVKLLKKDNTEPSLRSDLQEGVTTRNRIFDIKQFIKKRVKCKGCGKILYRHYHRMQRTKGFVCSKECHGKWLSSRKGNKHPNWKKRKLQKCFYCGKFTSTPSDTTRKKKYCSNLCQIKYERNHKNEYKRYWKTGKWAKKYDSCRKCGSKEKSHKAKGLCITCYQNQR